MLHVKIGMDIHTVPKKSSYYQSRYRARLREKGYVKRELWIPPEFSKSAGAVLIAIALVLAWVAGAIAAGRRFAEILG